jgi:hypothetical protein
MALIPGKDALAAILCIVGNAALLGSHLVTDQHLTYALDDGDSVR